MISYTLSIVTFALGRSVTRYRRETNRQTNDRRTPHQL